MVGKNERPPVLISLKLPMELWVMLNNKVNDKTFPNFSDAIRCYAQLGLKMESFKQQIKDPEFLKSIDELKQNDKVFEWLATLTQSQKEGIAFAIQIDKENHLKQVKFV